MSGRFPHGRTCSKCRVHGNPGQPLRGHKKLCPFRYCDCSRCTTLSRLAPKTSLTERRAELTNEEMNLPTQSFPDWPDTNLSTTGFDQVELLLNGANYYEAERKVAKTKKEIQEGKYRQFFLIRQN